MSRVREVFDPSQPDSYGQRVQFAAFESVVLYGVLDDLWSWAWVLPQHPGILAPSGLGQYVDVSFMLVSPYAKVNALITSALLLLGALRRLPGAYLAALLGYHLQFVARFSLGKIGHASNVLGFALLALGAAHLAYRDPLLRRRAALGLTLLLLSLGYTWAGICKLRVSGLGWVDGHHLQLWIREKIVDGASQLGRAPINKLQRLLLANVRAATLLLSFGLLSELTSSLMLWRRARRWVLLGLTGMHLGILYAMDIMFVNNIRVLLVLSLPIAEIVDAALAWRQRSTQADAAPLESP